MIITLQANGRRTQTNMADYLYKSVVYKNVDNVASPPTDWATQKTEYETNHQADTIKIDEIQVAATTFEINKDFDDFHDMIVSPYDWGDIRELETTNRYELYLVTSEPIT